MPVKTKLVDTTEYDFSQWDSIVKKGQLRDTYPNRWFPNEHIKEEYIRQVSKKSDNEIRYLLRNFLLPQAGLCGDRHILKNLLSLKKNEFERWLDKVEFLRRLLNFTTPWEGITWVMDLLPDNPMGAMDTIANYINAHRRFLPEPYINGLDDCIDIIQAKYCNHKHPKRILCELKLIEFEWLVQELYNRMGFQTSMREKVGKSDVSITGTKDVTGEKQVIVLHCNMWRKTVGVDLLQKFETKINDSNANKGILITSSHFSKKANVYAKNRHNIEVLDCNDLNQLLNEHLGVTWPTKMIYIFKNKRQENLINNNRLMN